VRQLLRREDLRERRVYRHASRDVFFLDDASRFGLGVVVGTDETAELFLRGLHGLRADDTAAACRRLDIHLVLGTAAYPEGHGKIEKFNQTAQAQVLRGLTGAADVDDDCGALEIDPFGIPLERSVERLGDRCFQPLRGVMMLDAPSTPYRGRLTMRSRGPALGIQLSQPKHLVELH